MELILYWLSALVLLAFAVWQASLLSRTGSMAALFTLIVTLGLVCDNGIIAAGGLTLSESRLAQPEASRPRAAARTPAAS